jgi:hypothetical protein
MLNIIEIVHINQRLAYVYLTILFTTQENQLLAIDSFRVITLFEQLPNFRCRRWHFHSPISRNSIQTHLSFATDCHRLASTKLFSLAKTLYHNDRITIMNVTWYNLVCKTLDVGGGIFTALSFEIQFKHTFNSSIL